MDRDRFHNLLALNLGRNRTVEEKRFTVRIEEGVNEESPRFVIEQPDYRQIACFYASDMPDKVWSECITKEGRFTIEALGIEQDIKDFIKAVYVAYEKANEKNFL